MHDKIDAALPLAIARLILCDKKSPSLESPEAAHNRRDKLIKNFVVIGPLTPVVSKARGVKI